MAAGSIKPLSCPIPFRPHDYAYDPLFLVSGDKDHYKAAILARMSTAKFQICPIFANMFSDLPNHPCKQYIRRKTPQISAATCAYKSRLEPNLDLLCAKKPDIQGSDRAKYFHFPKIPVGEQYIPQLKLQDGKRSLKTGEQKQEPKSKTKKIQTLFRESSVQTSPWQPSFKVTSDTAPELIKLDFLKWSKGMPPGLQEVELIERARIKRSWEEKCQVKNEEELERRRDVVAAMERDEWAFREQEIQHIQDLRLKLLERMLNELHQKVVVRNETKLKMFAKLKNEEKEDKLKKLHQKAKRELRKLDMQHAGIDSKCHKVNIIDEHVQQSSELYAPLMRHGEHPKRWHLIIDGASQRFKTQFADVEDFDTLPTWLENATQVKDCVCLKTAGRRLCMRETKWTAPILKELHEELKALRKNTSEPYSLMKKIESLPSTASTPEVECISDADEELYQATVLIQAIIRGRATQVNIYEGRDRCRELIEELKYSSGLLDDEDSHINEYKHKIKLQQRQEQIAAEKLSRLQESLDRLQGNLAGSLLDFLNKELQRLLEERKAHALALLLERERYDREAAEAGRRQSELRRRREHDEMFKQIMKIQQETVDLYLHDILKESAEFVSDEEAKDYIRNVANKIDEEAYKLKEVFDKTIDEEDTVADLVHHFVLPEVQKQLIRNKLKEKQRNNLKTVHDAIYSKIKNLGAHETPGTSKQ